MKIIVITLAVIGISFLSLEGATTPLNVSLFPPISLFKEPDVIGLDVGIISTKSNSVYGVQIGLINHKVKKYMEYR